MKQVFALALAILLALAIGCRTADAPEAQQPEATTEATEQPTVKPSAEPTQEPTAEPEPTEAPEEDPAWRTVGLEVESDEYGHVFATFLAEIPAGATFRIEFPWQEDYTRFNETEETVSRRIHVPVETFFPNTPIAAAETEIAPHVTFTTADGTEYEGICPTFTYMFPSLEIVILTKTPRTDGVFRADKDGVLELEVRVSGGENASASVDGEKPVYANEYGVCVLRLNVTGEGKSEHTIRAEANNCVSATLTFTAVP